MTTQNPNFTFTRRSFLATTAMPGRGLQRQGMMKTGASSGSVGLRKNKWEIAP
jgi:hypothetical protein